MFLSDLLLAFLFAAVFTFLFAALIRTRTPWSSVPLLFIVLFLAIWAGGIWISPVEPGLWRARWAAFFFVGLIAALLLAAAVASTPVRESTVELVDVKKRRNEKRLALTALGVFFWLLVLALIGIIVARYFF